MTVTNIREGGEWNGKGDFLIECDAKGCTRSLDAKDRYFQQAMTFMKAQGWITRRVKGSWLNYCPDCKLMAHF